jgi:hypothetical protein
MSSAYLTSKNMTMIERLLLEIRAVPRNRNQETMRARFLIDQFQGGVIEEADLRSVLNMREIKDSGTSRRLAGGDVVSRTVGALFGSRFLDRDAPQIIVKKPAPRPGRDEAQRRIDNDTDGRHRRENEVKSRHRMH